MELMFKLEEGEVLSNFAVASAIYFASQEPANDTLDPIVIANMMREQVSFDERKKLHNDLFR